MAVHPNSLANLTPFAKGHDPRRAVGAPSLGREFTADLNELGRKDDNGDAVYPVSELERIIESPKSAHSKVAAAQEILRMRLAGYDKMERVPKAADTLNRVCDRTDGKPTVRIETTVTHQPSLEELETKLVEALASLPEGERHAIATMLDNRKLLPAQAKTNTTAKP